MNVGRGSGTRNVSEVRRVLIVDDNHDSADLIAMVLAGEGHETLIAHDPREAIPMAVQFKPHVAFLDIGLPGMDGFELLQALHSKPELKGCKFVAVTGYQELECLPGSPGFHAHLVKPINLGDLIAAVCDGSAPNHALRNPSTA